METNLLAYGNYSLFQKECVDKFGSVFDLPIINEPYSKAISFYKEGNVLDLGAGHTKPLYKLMSSMLDKGSYYSLDNDPSSQFDFKNCSDIPIDLKFNFIFANQFFEHLSIDSSIQLALQLCPYLNHKGVFLLTIPNIHHPNRFWGDITHVTHWNYSNIYALYKIMGIEVSGIYRYSKRQPRGVIEKLLAHHIGKIYRMDWCDSILMIGIKNGEI